jgi:hypothetical protein
MAWWMKRGYWGIRGCWAGILNMCIGGMGASAACV